MSHCDGGDSETGSDTLSNHSSEETKFLFDVDKKPPRGILKKRGKYSGSDSSCGLEESTATSPGHVSPVSSDLSYELSDMSAVSEEDITSTVPMYRNNRNTLLDESVNLQYTMNDLTKDSLDSYKGFDPFGNRVTKESTSSDDTTEDTPRNMSSPCTLSTEDMSQVPVRRGILKRPKRSITDDQKNRNSMGSQGSNSSGDLLDFSYDSTEGENFMSKFCVSTKPASKPSPDISMDSEEDSISNRTRFHSMSVSEEDLSFKDCVFEDLDLEEARDICRKALEICSIKGVWRSPSNIHCFVKKEKIPCETYKVIYERSVHWSVFTFPSFWLYLLIVPLLLEDLYLNAWVTFVLFLLFYFTLIALS